MTRTSLVAAFLLVNSTVFAFEVAHNCTPSGKSGATISSLTLRGPGDVSSIVNAPDGVEVSGKAERISFGKTNLQNVEINGLVQNSTKGFYYELHAVGHPEIKEMFISAPASKSPSIITDSNNKEYQANCIEK